MSKHWTICAAAIFSLALSGCEPDLKTVCPTLKNYTAARLKSLAAEYPGLPRDVQDMISDYRLLRKECRSLETTR